MALHSSLACLQIAALVRHRSVLSWDSALVADCTTTLSPVGGWVADRTGASPVVLSAGLAAASVAALGFTVADGLLPFALIMLAYASLLAPLTPIADALAISAGKLGGGLRLYGWVRGAGSGAFILGSAIAGQVVGAFGNAIVVWMQCALLLVSAVFAWRGQSALAVRGGRAARNRCSHSNCSGCRCSFRSCW